MPLLAPQHDAVGDARVNAGLGGMEPVQPVGVAPRDDRELVAGDTCRMTFSGSAQPRQEPGPLRRTHGLARSGHAREGHALRRSPPARTPVAPHAIDQETRRRLADALLRRGETDQLGFEPRAGPGRRRGPRIPPDRPSPAGRTPFRGSSLPLFSVDEILCGGSGGRKAPRRTGQDSARPETQPMVEACFRPRPA